MEYKNNKILLLFGK